MSAVMRSALIQSMYDESVTTGKSLGVLWIRRTFLATAHALERVPFHLAALEHLWCCIDSPIWAKACVETVLIENVR
jgi:hypothetical protein